MDHYRSEIKGVRNSSGGYDGIGAKISGLSVEKFCIWSKKLIFFRKTIEF